MFWHRANTEGLSGMCKGVTRKGRQLCAVCQRWDARGGGGCHMSHFSSVLLCTLHMLHQLVLTTLPFRRWENRAPALGFISLSLWSNPFFWLEGIKLIRPRAWLSPFPNPRLSGSWCSGLLIKVFWPQGWPRALCSPVKLTTQKAWPLLAPPLFIFKVGGPQEVRGGEAEALSAGCGWS